MTAPGHAIRQPRSRKTAGFNIQVGIGAAVVCRAGMASFAEAGAGGKEAEVMWQ